MNIRRIIRDYLETQCRKHSLARDAGAYVDQQINKMTNDELLDAISDAVDALLAERKIQ